MKTFTFTPARIRELHAKLDAIIQSDERIPLEFISAVIDHAHDHLEPAELVLEEREPTAEPFVQ